MGGLLLIILSLGIASWLLTSASLDLTPGSAQVSGLRYTSRAAVLAAIGLSDEATPNIFGLSPSEMDRSLQALPAIAAADVRVGLPNRLTITVVERTPVLGLRRSDGSFVMDADGVILARTSDADLDALGVPIVVDTRTDFLPQIEMGQPLDQVEVTAMLQLAAVTPTLLDSSAATLQIAVDDEHGYVMDAEPTGWQAVFGSYTPTLRPPDIIPRQVECLRSLLARDEAGMQTIFLAPLDDRCGTFVPRQTPRSSPTPEPPG